MPKGGDLHHHYSGSVYAETYLEYVVDNDCYEARCYELLDFMRAHKIGPVCLLKSNCSLSPGSFSIALLSNSPLIASTSRLFYCPCSQLPGTFDYIKYSKT